MTQADPCDPSRSSGFTKQIVREPYLVSQLPQSCETAYMVQRPLGHTVTPPGNPVFTGARGVSRPSPLQLRSPSSFRSFYVMSISICEPSVAGAMVIYVVIQQVSKESFPSQKPQCDVTFFLPVHKEHIVHLTKLQGRQRSCFDA